MNDDHRSKSGAREESLDATLLAAAREGDDGAYAELWSHHSEVARRVARSLTQSFDADDIVSEAFTAILGALRSGKGPTNAFRPYLFATIRNIVAGWGRARREQTYDAAPEVVDPRSADLTVFAEADAALVMRALQSLPERWREVLWLTEVDALQPAEVADRLGMSANSAAALAYRAREGLRQAWIQAHVDVNAASDEHRWALEHIGQNARDALSARNQARFDQHLTNCALCREQSKAAVQASAAFTSALLPLSVGVISIVGVGAMADHFSAPPARADDIAPTTAPHAARTVDRKRRHRRIAATVVVATAVASIGAWVAGAATVPRHASDVDQPIAAVSPSSSALPVTPSPDPSPSPSVDAPFPSVDAPSPAVPTPLPSLRPSPVVTTPPPTITPPRIEVDTVPLEITSADTAGGVLSPIVSGKAPSGSTVTVVVGPAAVTVVASSAGAWQTNPISLGAGSFAVSARSDGTVASGPAVTLSSPTVSVTRRLGSTTALIQGAAGATYEVVTANASQSAGTDDSGAATVELPDGINAVTVYAISGGRTGPRTTISVPAE